MRRALIVANKWWEADPLVAVLTSARTNPQTPLLLRDDEGTGLRGVFEGTRGRIEVWCLQEMMGAAVSGSSSEEKARVLQPLLESDDVAIVVAFGTAASADDETQNGSVVSGTCVFLHDARLGGSSSHWQIPRENQIVTSALTDDAFEKIAGSPDVAQRVATLALEAPNVPAKPAFAHRLDFVALADVNVTDYHKYTDADKTVVRAFNEVNPPNPIGSLETTHGVIRECLPDNVPFMFVSGITDTVGLFDQEVTPAKYQQNFVAAHNAGLAIAAMLPALMAFLTPE